MIDGDYVRLGSACHCGKELKLLTGRGRPPKFCEAHKTKPQKEDRPAKECPACRGFFTPVRDTQGFCSRACRYKNKHNPKGNLLSFACSHCGATFESDNKIAMYCSKRCKQYAWIARNNIQIQRQPKVCAYWAGYCDVCNCAIGSKVAKKVCDSCRRSSKLKTKRYAAREASEAIHRAVAKVVTCDECGCEFCPIYGSSNSILCQCCVLVRKRIQHSVYKALRRAREIGADSENVNPFKVFDRDRWRCQLCGVKTPKSKRGTYADNAPELDHIIPLSKGGAHKYTNTQCACRKCNGLKSDKPLGQMLMFG